MHFETGKYGAVVIVVALSLTIVLGCITDVSRVPINRTDYQLITDITGLFDTEQIPEYTVYNPNSNYVGYDGNIEYVSSNQPNNYMYVVSDGTVTEDRDTLNWGEIRPLPSGMVDFTFIYLNYTGSTYNLEYKFNNNLFNVYAFANDSGQLNTPSITTLYDIVVNSDIDYQNSQTLELDFSTSLDYPVFVLPSINAFTKTINASNTETWTAIVNDDNVLERVVIDVVTMLAHVYKGATEIWTGSATDIPIIYSYQANAYTGSNTDANVPIVLTMDARIIGFPTYGYAEPQGGVTFNGTGSGSALWSNGYDIETVTIFIGRNTANADSVTLWFAEGNGNQRYVSVEWVSDNLSVVFGSDGVENQTNFGKWQGVIIEYNFKTGRALATPTGSIRDYTMMPSVRGETITGFANLDVPSQDLNGIRFVYTSSPGMHPARFGIYETAVFLNSFDVVMQDPSIDILDYWPNLTEYRLNFYSFALIGDSLTINDVVLPIDDLQRVSIPNEDGSYSLNNIYVTVSKVDGVNHTFLTFVNDTKTFDLGETVNDTVSFSGIWYFTSSLFDAKPVTGYEYEWNFNGFTATPQQAVVIFLGLLGVGVLIGRVGLKQEVSWLDLLIIIFAGVVAVAILGVFQ